jgi:hypothetical protein
MRASFPSGLLPAAVLVALCSSCGGNSGNSVAPEPDAGADTTPDTDTGPEVTVAPFALTVSADRTVAVPGQDVLLEVLPIDAAGEDLIFTWSEGEPRGGAPTGRTVRFSETGTHSVSVTAADADGNEVTAGAVILVFEAGPHFVGDIDDDGEVADADRAALAGFLDDATDLDTASWRRADLNGDLRVDRRDLRWLDDAIADAAPAPTRMIPDRGSRGTVVRLVHPALLDPAATVMIQVGEAPALVPLRGLPGTAAFAIPPGLTRPGAVDVHILVDGGQAATLSFELMAPAQVSDTPGLRLAQTNARLVEALDQLPALVDEVGVFVELSDDDRKILGGMLSASTDQLRAHHVGFQEAMGLLTPEARSLYEELALANNLAGVDAELDLALEDLRTLALQDAGALTPGASQRIIAIICLARRIADISAQVADINAKVSSILSYIPDWVRLVPGVGPILAFLDGVSAIVGIITDIIGTVASFLPDFGESIQVMAMPEDLANGDSTALTYTLPLRISSGLCRGGGELFADAIVSRLRERLIRSIGSRIPVVGYIFRRQNLDRDELGRIEGFVYDRVGDLADGALNAIGLKAALARIASGVCRAILGKGIDPDLTLTSEVTPEASCGEVELGAWSCNRDCPDQGVVITARATLCRQMLTGNTTVTCAGCRAECPEGCCTEDQTCVPAMDQSDEQCGAMGAMCGMCGEGQTCSEGECVCASTCTQEQAEQSARMCFPEDMAGLCKEVEPGCFRWETTDCAAGQATCVDGECEGGCGDWNCAGCCDFQGEPSCQDGDADDACGEGGNTCAQCNTGEGYQCRGGDCKCTDPRCEDSCPDGCDTGDPHLVTLDGLAYDFQAEGEFILVESKDRDTPITIQTRQVPLPSSLCPTVAINQAVAARVGASRVAVYADERPGLRVDGAPIALDLGASLELADGSVTRRGFATWHIAWSDGSLLRVTRSGPLLNLAVSLAPDRRGRVQGLLGDGDGSRDNDITTRDGTPLSAPVPWLDLHRSFGDSFRVERADSLFDYQNGRTARSYDNRAFPALPTRMADLPVDLAARARQDCEAAGIEDLALLEACIVDVACSGDPSLAWGLTFVDPPAQSLELAFDAPRPPLITSVAPQVVLAGGYLYVRGEHLTTAFGRFGDTEVLITGRDADDLPIERSLELVRGRPNHLIAAVPVGTDEEFVGAALVSVVTPGGEATAPTPVYFTAEIFGVGDAEPGHGLLGTVYALEPGTRQLPNLDDPCNDPDVQNTESFPCPVTSLILARLDVPVRGFSDGFPGVEDLREWFAIRFVGFVLIPEAGVYNFDICSDDGSTVHLDLPGDDFIFIENDGTHGYQCRDEQATLPAGPLPITVDYFQGPATQIALQLFWTAPGGERVVVPDDRLLLFPVAE